jgi:predicted NUDIX family phosphoesterase
MTRGGSSEEKVLCVPRATLEAAGVGQGFTPLRDFRLGALYDPGLTRFVARGRAERDESLKQVIPYGVVNSGAGVLGYVRARGGGEARLRGRFSIGWGGHVNPEDKDAGHCLWRELAEELEVENRPFAPAFLECVGAVNDDSNPVGRVHVGLVFRVDWSFRPGWLPRPQSRDPGVGRLSWHSPSALLAYARDPETLPAGVEMETWSRHVIEALPVVLAVDG